MTANEKELVDRRSRRFLIQAEKHTGETLPLREVATAATVAWVSLVDETKVHSGLSDVNRCAQKQQHRKLT